jgi:hypothetical protein
LAAVLDEAGVEPNPARDRRIRLPYEEQEELVPPTAEHVEAVYRLLPSVHRLPLLWLDWSGARVASIDLTLVSDYDEPRCRVRLRRSATRDSAALWIELPDALADALERALPPREDRDSDAQFSATGASSISRRCCRRTEGRANGRICSRGVLSRCCLIGKKVPICRMVRVQAGP